MTQIYLAGPFFDADQVKRIEAVEDALRQNPTVTGFFSPRTEEVRDEIMGSPAWAAKIYQKDVVALEKAGMVVAVVDYIDGQVDSGTAFEIGYAVQANIPVLVVQTVAETLNLMIGESLRYYTRSIADVASYDFQQQPANRYVGETF